jgi:hypothetical protein
MSVRAHLTAAVAAVNSLKAELPIATIDFL